MEEVGVLRETVGSRNNHTPPQDKIHFKKFFFFCRKIGAPLDCKRPTLGQRLCHRATEPQRGQGDKGRGRQGESSSLPLVSLSPCLLVSPSLCLRVSVAVFRTQRPVKLGCRFSMNARTPSL